MYRIFLILKALFTLENELYSEFFDNSAAFLKAFLASFVFPEYSAHFLDHSKDVKLDILPQRLFYMPPPRQGSPTKSLKKATFSQ